MKLIKEFIFKEIILFFLALVIIEVYIAITLSKRENIIYDTTYEETVEKIQNKTIEVCQKFEEFSKNYLSKYLADLKMIILHSVLFNINRTDDNNLNNENKTIYTATLEELSKIDYLKKFQKDEENVYVKEYEKEFENTTDTNKILNRLFNNHSELDSIGYYNPNDLDMKSLDENEIKAIKNMISILKPMYIKRYLIKRNNSDYIRFFIFNKNKMFIYPPSPYNLTPAYFFHNINGADCTNTSFPKCYYDYTIKSLSGFNCLIIIREKMNLQNCYGSICLRMKYLKNQAEDSLVCVEIEFSKLFQTSFLSIIEQYDFGMFTYLNENIFPVINIDDKKYDLIVKHYNNTNNPLHQLIPLEHCKLFTFFHFFYYNLSESIEKHPELKVDWKLIDEEYQATMKNIIGEVKKLYSGLSQKKYKDYITVDFTKSLCQKNLLGEGYEIVKDQFKMFMIPVSFEIINLDSNYIETNLVLRNFIDMFIYAIIPTNPKLNKDKLISIVNLKMQRTVLLYCLMSFIVLSLLILFICYISQLSLDPIYEILNQLKNLEIRRGNSKDYTLDEDKIKAPNKEIAELKDIYEFMRKILIVKNAFEKENYLKKHNLEFYNLTRDIKKKEIKNVCLSFLGFYHFKNDAFSLAESEFHSTVLILQENENKILRGKNDEYDDKLKDSIKRSSSESYINEYSTFEKLDENMLIIIKMKILRQRFIYLYAMTKYRLGMEMTKGKNTNQDGGMLDKKKAKRDKDKKLNYFKDAINYFTECKNINTMLGINQIKVIYILIMISKCYTQLNDYREAMENINEALSLFLELSKSFKDYHSKYYNPRIMLFIENNIFHYILYTISSICNTFNKQNACNWINLKLFETSPFLIGNVHYKSGSFIHSFFEKTKIKLTKYEMNLMKNTYSKQLEKTKKYFSKLIPRINAKSLNLNKKNLLSEKLLTDASHSTSINKRSESIADISNFSSNFRKDYQTGKSSSFIVFKKNINKIITLCLSEKILKKINGMELKDVIIKYYQKYFVLNENDKFSFIQFADNGKKTVYFKLEQLDSFLLKIQKAKNSFEMTDTYATNTNMPFMELYNIFDSIIKSYPLNEENLTDNIIIMFINTDDIRFQTIGDCIKIVEDLKRKNTSLFLLSYDDEISPEKINNIHSFLSGFFEGYFFQIQNYQQLKQIFINISNIKYQSNFFGYDFDIFDHTL